MVDVHLGICFRLNWIEIPLYDSWGLLNPYLEYMQKTWCAWLDENVIGDGQQRKKNNIYDVDHPMCKYTWFWNRIWPQLYCLEITHVDLQLGCLSRGISHYYIRLEWIDVRNTHVSIIWHFPTLVKRNFRCTTQMRQNPIWR